MRKRIGKVPMGYKYKIGDLIKAELAGSKIKHICIILENEDNFGHIKCLPVCNFTSKMGNGTSDYSIDISKYNLPNEWFENKQTESWIRCNETDCIYNMKFSEKDILGNILVQFPDLWSEVCKAVHFCDVVSTKLNQICDCEYEKTNNLIEQGIIETPDCGCF